MRTTVDIPDPLYRELKGKAASEGRSVKELILRGVEQELEGPTWSSRPGHACPSYRRSARDLSSSTMPRFSRSFLFPDVNVWVALDLWWARAPFRRQDLV